MIAEFTDPRLVAVYDTVNAYEPGSQPDFYGTLATELDARRVVDLGCGTGLLTAELARSGFEVIGVEPSAAMLAVARRRPDCERVRWVEGGAEAIGTPEADLAIMTGHVAQFFTTDDAWRDALGHLHAGLRPGGSVAFETRNPEAREWERWSDVVVTGGVETWGEVHDVRDSVVSYTNHFRLIDTGEHIESPMELRFRTLAEVERSLGAAGFVVDRVFGDWDRRPPGPDARELIVVAQR